jgi:hypothetical protein
MANQLRLFSPEVEPDRNEDLDQWFTSPKIAQAFVDWCRVEPGTHVLEPAAGGGALVKPLLAAGAKVDAYEIDPAWAAYLRREVPDPELYVNKPSDFLGEPFPRASYSLAVMNPPLSDGLDGVFLARVGRYWARRTCSIIQTRTFHSQKRREEVWDLVKVQRVQHLSARPSFGRGSPAGDFSFVEVVLRAEPRGFQETDTVEFGFL